jgi:threonine/homoserine/homoserine lactone efflux protein
MTFESGLIFFISMLLMWIKPGPAQLMKITTTLDRGLSFGIVFSLGSAFMCSLFFVAAALGYQILSNVFSAVGVFLQVFGAIYLIYIGVKGLVKFYQNNKTKEIQGQQTSVIQRSSFFSCFAMGVLITLSNPFWIFYFIGILPSLISLENVSGNSYIIGAVLVFVSAAMVDWPMLTLIAQLKENFTGDRFAKYISLFVSLCFLLIAAFLLYSAFFAQSSEFDINGVL